MVSNNLISIETNTFTKYQKILYTEQQKLAS